MQETVCGYISRGELSTLTSSSFFNPTADYFLSLLPGGNMSIHCHLISTIMPVYSWSYLKATEAEYEPHTMRINRASSSYLFIFYSKSFQSPTHYFREAMFQEQHGILRDSPFLWDWQGKSSQLIYTCFSMGHWSFHTKRLHARFSKLLIFDRVDGAEEEVMVGWLPGKGQIIKL